MGPVDTARRMGADGVVADGEREEGSLGGNADGTVAAWVVDGLAAAGEMEAVHGWCREVDALGARVEP